jgi:hypothetical protein
MTSLLSRQRIDDPPAPHVRHGHTLLFGTSAGIRNVHDPRALPMDTITYFLRANAARERIDNGNGLFFAFDKRLHGDTSDHAAIQQRTERLRQLLGLLLPDFAMKTHSELEERGLAATIERVEPCPAIENEELRQYTRVQTAQVLQLYEESLQGAKQRFAKFGWILSRRANGVPVGGEVNFDQLLPDTIPIERVYTAPAFPLDSTNGKAPYLLSESDRQTRVCLADREADIGPEVLKVRSGINRVMFRTLQVTAEAVLGDRSEIHSPDDELVTLPLTKAMRQQVTDERELADLRELLSASLRKLLP